MNFTKLQEKKLCKILLIFAPNLFIYLLENIAHKIKVLTNNSSICRIFYFFWSTIGNFDRGYFIYIIIYLAWWATGWDGVVLCERVSSTTALSSETSLLGSKCERNIWYEYTRSPIYRNTCVIRYSIQY